ncbi:MAG: HAMP domain-containing histidine kinase [Moraxellaceae bacterium]|nr:HAMP domain-containing histidine kinase [Pseudobdellovibrionaceae bacterium]
MKAKTIHAMIGAIVLIVVVVVWKLNSYYKQEKSAFVEGQIHQQSITLKTSISSQIAQLKNVISSYQGQIDESKINWVQINPFFALAQLDIAANGTYVVKNLYIKSGTPAENWSKDYLQKAFSYSPFSNKDIHVQLFQNQTREKFLSLIFSDEKIRNSRQAVALVGDAVYFQKYFDIVRSAKNVNVLMTSDNVVVGHTQSDYIATQSQESKLNSSKYFMDRDEIRSSNLSVISYSAKLTKNEFLAIPLFVLIFVFGFSALVIGILLYVLKPIENEQRKADIFKKVFDEVQNPKPAVIATAPVVAQVPLQEKIEYEVKQEIKQTAPDLFPSIFEQAGKRKIALGEVVDLALSSLTAHIADSGVKIVQDYKSEKKYDCDVDRFRKALENIITNSIEAKAKNISIKIYEDPRESKSVVNIDIIDDGEGLAPGTEEKIWQPFYGTKDKSRHRGLGLSEALSVVRRYGADVRVLENPLSRGVLIRIEMDAELRKSAQAFPVRAEVVSNAPEQTRADIDIDAILDLRDDDETTAAIEISRLNIEHEFTTTQFKMDEKVDVVAQPHIQFDKATKLIDNFAVKVRRPGRT